MKFIVIRLLTNPPDPDDRPPGLGDRGARRRRRGSARTSRNSDSTATASANTTSTTPRPRRPPVILGYLAASTKRIRLFTGVTVLSLLDPVRVAEDYATRRRAVRRACRADHRQGQHRGTVEGLRLHERRPVGAQPRELRAAPPSAARGARHLEGRLPAAARRASRPAPARCSSRSASGTAARRPPCRPTWRPSGATRCSRPTSPDRSSSTRRSSTTTANGGSTTGATRPTRSSAPARPVCTSTATRDAPSRSSGRATRRSRRSPADSACLRRSRRSRTRSSAGRTSSAARSRSSTRCTATTTHSDTRSSTPPASAARRSDQPAPASNCSPPRSSPICNATFPTGSWDRWPDGRNHDITELDRQERNTDDHHA